MVMANTVDRLPETETFTVQDLLALQGHKDVRASSISYAQRARLKRKLRSEYTAVGDVRRGAQQMVQDVLNLLNAVIFAPASTLSWLEHCLRGQRNDIAYGRERIARLRPSAGIKNLRQTFKNTDQNL